jgi:hypothetical protein
MSAAPEPPSDDPGEPRETEAQRRARILAELERSLAEGLPAAEDPGWQYPPAPMSALPPPLPPRHAGFVFWLCLLIAVGATALLAVIAGIVAFVSSMVR